MKKSTIKGLVLSVLALAMYSNAGATSTLQSIDKVQLGVHINGNFSTHRPGSTIEIEEGDDFHVLLRGMPGKVRLKPYWSASGNGLHVTRGDGNELPRNKPHYNAAIFNAGVGMAVISFNAVEDVVPAHLRSGSITIISKSKIDVARVRQLNSRLRSQALYLDSAVREELSRATRVLSDIRDLMTYSDYLDSELLRSNVDIDTVESYMDSMERLASSVYYGVQNDRRASYRLIERARSLYDLSIELSSSID